MPLGPYRDFDDCVAKNSDKENPEAYCGALERDIAPKEGTQADTIPRVRFQIVPVTDEPETLAAEAETASIEVEVKVEIGEEEEEPEMMLPGTEEVEDDETEVEDEIESLGAPYDFHSLLVVEGVWTGDGRYIDENALGWRDLPLPLMATDRTTEGHMDAMLIGNIVMIERVGRELHAYGLFTGTDDEKVRDLQNLVRRGELRGVSVDLDSVEYEVIVPIITGEEPTVDADGNAVVAIEDPRMRITSARVMGATVVPFPAFQEAFIESFAALTASLLAETAASGFIQTFATYGDINFIPPEGARDEAKKGLEWRREHGRGGTEIGVARARDIANGKKLSPETVQRMVSYFARHEVDKQGEGWNPSEAGYPSAGRIAWALWGGDPGRTWAEKVKKMMDDRDDRGSIVASGYPIEAPIVPPAEWFSNPNLTGPTPLTVSDEGRIFGHLAVWGQCHVGHSYSCVQPPSSKQNYAHFLTGEILCDGGERFPVGQITMNSGHASHDANAAETAAHYDNTALAVADVTAGEDAHGIWVSGAIRPDLHPQKIRALMASDVSGDWRRIGGNLELIAILAVNVPGFPKIRVKEAAGLVASLSLPAYETTKQALEIESDRKAIEALAASIGRTRGSRIGELVSRVRPEKIDEIVARVRGGK